MHRTHSSEPTTTTTTTTTITTIIIIIIIIKTTIIEATTVIGGKGNFIDTPFITVTIVIQLTSPGSSIWKRYYVSVSM